MVDFDAFDALTFDCYGTLIDWETGHPRRAAPVLARTARRRRRALLEAFARHEAELEAGPYLPLPRRARAAACAALGGGLRLRRRPTPRRAAFGALGRRLAGVRRTAPRRSQRLKQRFRLGVITNCDDDLFARVQPRASASSSTGSITAQQAGGYKPRRGELRVRVRAHRRAARADPARRPEPVPRPRARPRRSGMTTVWVDRRHGREGFGATPPAEAQPDLTVPDLRSFAATRHWLSGASAGHDPPIIRRAMTVPTQDAATDVVLARQPIFDADLRISAFELLYRAVGEEGLPLHPSKATATVLVAALTDVGLDRLVGDQCAFINVNREFLLSFRPLPLPADRVVLELVEDQIMDADLMDVLGELVTVGFTLALDNFSYRPEYEPLLRLAKIAKLNVQTLTPEELAQHVRRLRDWDLQIIAEKVETREQLDYCRQLGIDGFQGYFFARPSLMAERSAPTFRLDGLAKLLEAGEDDFDALEEMISHDAGLSHKLLRLANSAHVAPRNRIRSIRHALSLLGGRTVRRWTMLLMLAGRHGQPHELLVTALVRARLLRAPGRRRPAGRGRSRFHGRPVLDRRRAVAQPAAAAARRPAVRRPADRRPARAQRPRGPRS